MDVARLNFSHGSHADHEAVYHLVREAAEAAGRAGRHPGRPAGPEDPARPVRRRPARVAHRRHASSSPATTSSAPRPGLLHLPASCPQEVKAGDRLLIDDGKVAVEVTGVDGNDIRCLVIEGGPVSNNKGVSLPNVAVSVPGDVREGRRRTCASRCGSGVDLIALSFVRSPDDIKLVHEIMDEEGVAPPGASPRSRSRRRSTDLEAIVRRLRRRHGGPRRPRRRAAAGPGAAGAEARRAAVPGARQAGHRGHPDARLDDRELAARPAPRPPTSPTRCSTAPTR